MLRIRSSHVALSIVVAALALTSHAHGQMGGILVYENGSPDMGLSYAGFAARAGDASTVTRPG